MKSTKSTLLSTASIWEAPFVQILLRLIVYAPAAWLTVFGLFILAVFLQFGHWPTYGLPDPKAAGLGSVLYLPTIALLIWVMSMAPLGVLLTLVKLWKGSPATLRWGEALLYLVGLSLFCLLVFNDTAGLLTWLAD